MHALQVTAPRHDADISNLNTTERPD